MSLIPPLFSKQIRVSYMVDDLFHEQLLQAIDKDDVQGVTRVIRSNPAILETLVYSEPDTFGINRFTPLSFALTKGSFNVVRELIRHDGILETFEKVIFKGQSASSQLGAILDPLFAKFPETKDIIEKIARFPSLKSRYPFFIIHAIKGKYFDVHECFLNSGIELSQTGCVA